MGLETAHPVPVFYNDPFNPMLFDKNTKAVTITFEQEDLVRKVLLLSSSDSRFAQKAADALRIILLGGAASGPAPVPTLTGLQPPQRQAGTSGNLKVIGTNFNQTSIVFVNGNQIVTLFTSATELTCTINLAGVSTGTQLPVVVQNSDGLVSNTLIFNVT